MFFAEFIKFAEFINYILHTGLYHCVQTQEKEMLLRRNWCDNMNRDRLSTTTCWYCGEDYLLIIDNMNMTWINKQIYNSEHSKSALHFEVMYIVLNCNT